MKKLVISIISALLLGTVTMAGPEENFTKYDTNQDGLMQKEEYMAMRAKWGKDPAESEKGFKWKDKDGDGALTKEEFLSHLNKKK
ncbi:hypothetical protein G0Q06_12055 [Puniceicoccales bacterium CK1056]|uniref:EF-hand domain-containing protein n=1 Tax=Oceanipulchritudo coccoides TaxID=2706888 RepID=A0A6B2M4M8_9BACT|nr:hypothetical protein [Oceanipulchritudo coccoides]NDV63189.1 hypothetical protein [Oceanipulchritudo coccoides]